MDKATNGQPMTMQETFRKIPVPMREAITLKAIHQAEILNIGASAVSLFTQWVHEQDDPATFINDIINLDDVDRFSAYHDPVTRICELILSDPCELPEMMYAYGRFHGGLKDELIDELEDELKREASVVERQANVIKELRSLVAPGKLKKYDAERAERIKPADEVLNNDR